MGAGAGGPAQQCVGGSWQQLGWCVVGSGRGEVGLRRTREDGVPTREAVHACLLCFV